MSKRFCFEARFKVLAADDHGPEDPAGGLSMGSTNASNQDGQAVIRTVNSLTGQDTLCQTFHTVW